MSDKGHPRIFLYQGTHKRKLVLPIGQEVFVGRSPFTGIKDRRLSRKHLKVFVPKHNVQNEVVVEHVGSNLSTINGKIIRTGFIGAISPGDKFELLEGKYEFELVMEENSTKQRTPELNKHWSSGLLHSMNDPNMVWYQDNNICIIKDKYPKAKHHFLVLPKNDIPSLKHLTNQHVNLVQFMIKTAEDEVIKKLNGEGNIIEFSCGFHAVPSMAQFHMHVISQDFVSPCLKTKKHWNSFNTNYFIPAEILIKHLNEDGRVPTSWEKQSKEWLAMEVKCHRCSYRPKGMGDAFKKHLEDHMKFL